MGSEELSMKKWRALGVVGLALCFYFHSIRYGIRIGGVHLAWAPDKQRVEERANDFLEAIQFKDFVRAATNHSDKDQAGRDIPRLIEAKFQVKPELLDIKSFEILRVDLAGKGDRAK